jgi:hypothetical protein
MPSKSKGKPNGKEGKAATSNVSLPGISKGDAPVIDAMAALPAAERKFVSDCVSISVPPLNPHSYPGKDEKAAEQNAVDAAVEALGKYHMCILSNALSEQDLDIIQQDFDSMLDFAGDSAIGEKSASKRSATRMYVLVRWDLKHCREHL